MTKARTIADLGTGFVNITDTGTEGTKVASGTTAQRGTTAGQWRYNTTTNFFEGRNVAGDFLTLEPTPTITSSDVTEIDSQAGGNATFVIGGTNFTSGGTVSFIGTSAQFNASTTTFNNGNQVTAVAPKASFLNAQEPYKIRFTSANGVAGTSATGLINVDTAPTWSTSAGSLGTIQDDATGTHFTLSATDADGDAVTYAVQSGSLPAGTSLNASNGQISGDPTDVTNDTTSNFTVRATAGGKTVDRAFSIITSHNYGYPVNNLSFNLRARDHSFSNNTSVNDGTSLTLLHAVSGITAEVEYGNQMYFYNSSGGIGASIPNYKFFNFNGASGSIEINGTQAAMNTCFNGATSQSTAVWFHWSSDSGRQVLMSRYGTISGENVQQWNQIVDPGREFHYNSSGVISSASGDINTTFFNNGTWHLHHKVYNVSDGIFRWYIDGSQVHTINVGTDSGNGLSGYNNSTFPFSIGSRTDNSEQLNGGSVGEARHYHRALTATEISNEWTNTKGDWGRS